MDSGTIFIDVGLERLVLQQTDLDEDGDGDVAVDPHRPWFQPRTWYRIFNRSGMKTSEFVTLHPSSSSNSHRRLCYVLQRIRRLRVLLLLFAVRLNLDEITFIPSNNDGSKPRH